LCAGYCRISTSQQNFNEIYRNNPKKKPRKRTTFVFPSKEIGQYLAKNYNFCFSCSIGFAGILLEPLKIDTGTVFNFVGDSGSGKSTLLRTAASIFANPKDNIRSWKGTAGGLEGMALLHNHRSLYMDEIHQADVKTIDFASYDLPNGAIQQRTPRT